MGLPFTLEEVRASMIVERELDDAELEAISGGRGACYYIGFTTEPEIECGNGDGHICAYGGIGIPG